MTMMIKGISSMATRELLADLSEQYNAETTIPVSIESIGGVDATRRVNQGEVFDLVVLSVKAIDTLTADGLVATASKIDIAESGVAIAVQANAARPDISNADALKQAVLGASSIGYSTGPSGVALAQLFSRWGIIDELGDRFVQASPGVPVGELLANGDVELGFQQLSELIHIRGIDVIGPLPDTIQIITIFSAGICTTATQPAAAAQFLEFLTSTAAQATVRRHGMEPVPSVTAHQ